MCIRDRSRAEIIDITKIPHSDKVVFGSTVIVNDITESKNKRMTYKIVGEYEANAEKGLIFFKSPLARALMGKEKGDFIEVHFPAGVKSFEIVDVKYI